MSTSRSMLVLALAPLWLAAPRLAHADDHGLELMVRGGYGGAGSKSPVLFEPSPTVRFAGGGTPDPGKLWGGKAEPYGGGFVGQASVGYRVLPFLSFGLAAGYRKSSASAIDGPTSFDPTGTDLARSAFSVGPYLRGYLPFVPMFDPWVSVGVSYMQDKQSWAVQGATATLTHYGVAIPVGVGLDYRVTPMLAIGPSFEYAFVAAAGGCAEFADARGNSASQCASAGPDQRVTAAKSYGAWSVGLDVRLTLF